MKRTGSRIDNEIPISQAAYRKDISTTEHVFGTKLVIERTITSKNETAYLILLDMSKAFDSIHRATLIDNLKHIINNDELHLVKALLQRKTCCQMWRTHQRILPNRYWCTPRRLHKCKRIHTIYIYLAKSLEQKQNCIPQIPDHIYYKSSTTDINDNPR